MKILKTSKMKSNPFNFIEESDSRYYKIKYINEKECEVEHVFIIQGNNEDYIKEGIILNYSDNKEDMFLIEHLSNIKITASERVKDAGLKNLNQMAEMTKQSTQTLNNWFNNKRELFEIILKGCKANLI